MPRATSSSSCCAMCDRSSRSRSASACPLLTSERNRFRVISNQRWSMDDSSGVLERELDGGREAFPLRNFRLELGAAGPGQRVEASFPPGFILLPLGANEPLALEPVQGRVKGSLLDLEHVSRRRLDALGDGPAVARFRRKRLEDEHIERALNEVRWPHVPVSLGFLIPRRSTMIPRLSTNSGACATRENLEGRNQNEGTPAKVSRTPLAPAARAVLLPVESVGR